MNIDLSPMMQAVEDVIARHERYIGYCKAREARKKLRIAQKGVAICRAYQKSIEDVRSFPWYCSFAMQAAISSRAGVMRSFQASLFRTDKPELDPSRQRAYYRARRATTVSINTKTGWDKRDIRGLVDRLNSELKGAALQ